MTTAQELKIAAMLLIVMFAFMGPTCEAPPSTPKPCVPDTLTVYEYRYKSINFDSALFYYAPHTNLQTDTANMRLEIKNLKAEVKHGNEIILKLERLIEEQKRLKR